MRQILSISLPGSDIELIKKESIAKGFKNVSNYIKHLVISDQEDVISEKELLKEVKQAEKEYYQGKSIKADSMADLL